MVSMTVDSLVHRRRNGRVGDIAEGKKKTSRLKKTQRERHRQTGQGLLEHSIHTTQRMFPLFSCQFIRNFKTYVEEKREKKN